MSVVPPDQPEQAGPASPQPGVEEVLHMLTARLADFVSREDALAAKERAVQRALDEADAQRAELDRSRAEIEMAQRELDERLAALVERAATLALHEQAHRQAASDVDERRARREADAEQTLARAGKLRADLAKELAEFASAENAHRQAASTSAQPAEPQPSEGVLDAAGDRDQMRRLTELVKNAARHEAETVIKKAHLEARLIREQADAEREAQRPNPFGLDTTA